MMSLDFIILFSFYLGSICASDLRSSMRQKTQTKKWSKSSSKDIYSTCSGRCNAPVDSSKPCQCNTACISYNDCCPDYQSLCNESCVGRCGLPPDSNHQCQCNTACKTYNDCCDDYDAFCLGATCSGRCNALVDSSKPCQCNTACISYNDCCPDYQSMCNESCVGRCGLPPDSNHQCQCNTACKTYNDCCDDYDAFCLGATCSGRCNAFVDSSKPCQCNTACVSYNDCCPDYQSMCNGGGGSNPGCDMSCLAQQLWDSDVNKVSLLDMIHNYQGQTTSSGTNDLAPNKLFTYINENHFNSKPTFQKFIALLDNYNRNIGQTEELTTSEWNEIEDFLTTVLQTQVMKLTYDYLLNNGHVTGEADFKDVLKELWFNLYPRSSSSGTAVDSSGFEHAMVGETRGTVSGFHSWIQFYLEEKKGNLDYQGWVSKADPEIMGAKFTWYGQMKTKGSFFMRVSPEFDLALYSVCALTKPNAICSFTMAGHNIRIQTWDVAHKSGSQIGSAYPAI